MARHLPPLPALRAFEAAARHLSFARAGAELGVTPGAVSHHMKQLEAWVDGPLFERRANGVVLTETGRVFATRIASIFDQITAASVAARSPLHGTAVTVRCQFSLATKWLAPRLGRFRATHPDISVAVFALPHRWNANEPDPDVAIYHGRGTVPGMRQDLLIGGRQVVVAAPQLVAALPPAPTPADLLSRPMIKVDFAEPGWHDEGWEAWFAAAGFGHLELRPGLTFNLTYLAIEACLSGAGFALVPDFLVAQELASGRLIDPFGISLPVRQPYVIITPEASLTRPEVAIFRSWVLAEGQLPA
ncbi:LysR substrate-binding domain-containing protein [Microvirga alba]|uniref:LysR family transcriptional regulator n=1 Tax=Microvirga alba TaxID=2791025 RepID=A0A931BNP0_9HYPH|nr:LysR substrate-binding domain-containing protein [Microvirga alba]MBF9234601.1 LysR family transcriptional regulator [Microvirga alba]